MNQARDITDKTLMETACKAAYEAALEAFKRTLAAYAYGYEAAQKTKKLGVNVSSREAKYVARLMAYHIARDTFGQTQQTWDVEI